MPLIACPECAKEISDTAFKCVNCGTQLRKATRSTMGKIFKWTFILFNLLMPFWIWTGLDATSQAREGLEGAEAAGAAIGTGLGITMLVVVWLVGDIILGLFVLFTRPKES